MRRRSLLAAPLILAAASARAADWVPKQPIYPKNLYADKIPGRHAEYKREVIDRQVRLMQERDIWKAPG